MLVVDDDPDVRVQIRWHLAERYQVEEAADGASGLRRARELLPDLVVSDVMMPGMDGYALCRALKRDPELDCVPVILLTVKASTESRIEGLRGGADDYMTKPFDIRELLVRIDNLIATRRRLLERFSGAATSAAAAAGLPVAPGVRVTRDIRAFLERVREVIEENLGDEDFQVGVLASRLAIDRSHLYRRLRELTGLTPSALLLELRLERAAQLLEDGAGSVGEVASSVGFKDVSHFTKRFRKRFRMTPSAYRARRPAGHAS